MNHLKELIRAIPDYPKPGILFYDLTTLLKNPGGFHALVDNLCDHYAGKRGGCGCRHRGRADSFLLRRWAYRLKRRLRPRSQAQEVAIEKQFAVTYQLEYGTDTLEIHQDAIKPGQRVSNQR